MKPCKIINQNHTVISYTLNGKKQYIVEPIGYTGKGHEIVTAVISFLNSREWATVYNFIDSHVGSYMDLGDSGYFISEMSPAIETAIERLTS
jgi:hypothetical protein